MSRTVFARFRQDQRGSIAVQFALALVPILAIVGASVDYSRANQFRSGLQAAIDSAVLAGGKTGGDGWQSVALATFNGNVNSGYGTVSTPSFSLSSSSFSGTVSGSVPTDFLKVLHINSLSVGVTATAVSSPPDNSCILTLDKGQPTSHTSLSLNGAPIINLSGCSLRSNTSLTCNGHDGNNTAAQAAGLASACANPSSNMAPVPDIYSSMASNITTMCSSYPGANWVPGSVPAGSGVKSRTVTVGSSTYTEYHICGDLNLSGSGYLTGSTPSSDTVIVVENGSVNVANNASISTKRTALVLTGTNTSAPSAINFPNGNGQSATLTLSPPTDVDNPWQSVAVYQDPALTNVNETWGPGANFSADGLVYMPNANVVTDGNMGSPNSQCSKFVMNTLTTNGSVDLNMDQTLAACSAIGLKQWTGIVVYLSK